MAVLRQVSREASIVSSSDPNDTTLGLQIGVLTAVHAVALLAAGLRLYSRSFLAKSFGSDDATIAAATLLAFVSYILWLYQIPHGLGLRNAMVSEDDQYLFGAASFAETILQLIGLGFLKISVALALLRLVTGKVYTWVLRATIAFVSIYTLFAILTLILYCRPIDGFWDHDLGAECYSIQLFVQFGLANSALSIFTDILLASLPIPVIWKLQIPRKTRIYLILVLALGWAAVAIGIVKTIGQINYNPFGDTMYEVSVIFWAFVQLNISIIAACAPSLKNMLKPLLGLASTRGTSSNKRYLYGDGSRPPHTGEGTTDNRTHPRNSARVSRRYYTHETTGDVELDTRPIFKVDGFLASVQAPSQTTSTSRSQGSRAQRRSQSLSSNDSIFDPVKSTDKWTPGITRTTEVLISRD
ncbi:hypothetical protein GGR57DRAFT_170437 [Xylariaceae sp. FL1272]|nr:hypothetical protein GGR57DRAFT_170437 [Xylariaceae sp. FL1272]